MDHCRADSTVHHSFFDTMSQSGEQYIHALPLHAHWADGEPASEVISMASTANTTREFFVDDRPSVTGLLPLGDA